MGNVLAPAPAPAAPSFPALEEEPDCAALLAAYFSRQAQRSTWPLRAATRRWGAADAAASLSGGGGPPPTDSTGVTALHVAAANGWDELLDRLLETGRLGIDAPSRVDGYTPLMVAAACGRRHAVEALLAHGADPSKRSRRGASSLHFAAQTPQGQSALAALLAHPSCTPALVRHAGFRDRSPLMLSVLSHGSPGTVRQLLAAGADPSESVESMGRASVLHTAAHMARLDAMRELIRAGGNVNATASDGICVTQEVFLQAPNPRCTEAVKRQMFTLLREANANVGARVIGKELTVLHFAVAQCREEETANLLLDSNIDLTCGINQELQFGDMRSPSTMLHLAAGRGWTRLAEALVVAGADCTARNRDELQPLHSAILGRHRDTVAMLLRRGADPLAACPDLYPSFADWKVRMGMQAMQELMQGQGAALQGAIFGQLLGIDPSNPASDDPTLSAVDLACCVARDVPTVEAFLERGVRPSEEALRLAEHAVPIMRVAVERPLWTPELHRRLPPRLRRAARELLLCLNRPVRGSDGRAVTLTPDAVAAVLQQAAFPLFAWVDAAWFEAQTVRPPLRRSAAQQAQQQGPQQGQQQGPQQGQQPGGPPVGLAGLAAGMLPGAQVIQPGAPAPPFAQALAQAMQQHLPPGAAAPQIVMLPGPPPPALAAHLGGLAAHPGQPGQPGQPGAPAAAADGGIAGAANGGGAPAAGAGAGGAAGGAAPGGPALMQHQQMAVGPGQNLHVMQFQFDLPPGGPAAVGPAILGQMMVQVMDQLMGPNGMGPAAGGPAGGLAAGLAGLGAGPAGPGAAAGGAAGGPAGGAFPLPLMFDWGELLFGDDDDDDDEEEEEEEFGDDEGDIEEEEEEEDGGLVGGFEQEVLPDSEEGEPAGGAHAGAAGGTEGPAAALAAPAPPAASPAPQAAAPTAGAPAAAQPADLNVTGPSKRRNDEAEGDGAAASCRCTLRSKRQRRE